MKGYIYKYTFPDGKVYIGQTTRPLAARHREHTTPSSGRLNYGFWEAWTKFGNAKLETLETVEEESAQLLTAKLNQLEIEYIAQYQATNPKYGYNIALGGYAISVPKKRIASASRKIFNEIWEERAVFYDTLLEKVMQAVQSPVYLNEEQVELIREYALPRVDPEFVNCIKVSPKHQLSFRCKEKENADYYLDEAISWLLFGIQEEMAEIEQLERDVDAYVLFNSSNIVSQGVIQKLDKEGALVKEYDSITEIMHELNLSYAGNIYNALEGKQKTAYGFVWRWKNK